MNGVSVRLVVVGNNWWWWWATGRTWPSACWHSSSGTEVVVTLVFTGEGSGSSPPKLICDFPPGGWTTREEFLSDMKFPTFCPSGRE